jgi:hypothetical protein
MQGGMIQRGGGSRGGLLLAVAVLLLGVGFGQAAQVCVAWNPPTHSLDGQPLQDLAGYRIYYGTNSRLYNLNIDVGNTNAFMLTDLNGTATYYIAITAYNSAGEESGISQEMSWSGLDADANGMSDAWEQLHLAALEPGCQGPTGDADGDGICNIEEFIAGLNPTNLDQCVEMAGLFTNDQFQIRFEARSASGTGYIGKTRYYALERCTDLAQGTWGVVPGFGMIKATNQVVSYVTGPSPGATICRTRVWLQ